MGQLGRVHEADGDRLAVAQVVAARRLERVGQRVAVVQGGPAAQVGRVLPLVGRDDVGLDAHGSRDALLEVEAEQVGAGEEVVLGQLAPPGARAPAPGAWRARRGRTAPRPAARTRRRGSCPRGGSRRSCRRWPRRPCPSSVVGTCTTGIAAVVAGGREAGGVGDDAPADGDHGVARG